MRQIASEAVANMPVSRTAEVFGDVMPIDAGLASANGQGRASDETVRGFLRIADTFNRGASRETWISESEHGQGLHHWAAGVQATRKDIAVAAGHDPEEFEGVMNDIWMRFAGKRSALSPDLSSFSDLDGEMAIKLAFPNYPIELAVGFGGTGDQEISSRSFGWIMPALDFVQAFQEAGVQSPSVRIFSAHELSTEVNHLDGSVASQTAHRTQAALGQFVDAYYPDVRDSVNFEVTRIDEVVESIGKLGINGNARSLLEAVSSSSPRLGKYIQRLEQAGEKKGSDKDGTAHYVVWHGAPEVFGTYVDPRTDKVSVIKVGGPSEREFTALQRMIAKRVEPPDLTELSRTHSFARQLAESGPHQLSIEGNNHRVAPYYRDEGASDVRLLADGSLDCRTNGKPDRDTHMAQIAAGGAQELVVFMGNLTLPEYSL